MSLPTTANYGSSAGRAALPFASKQIFATPDSAKQSADEIREAIEHAARARISGNGKVIMGGIGVGPTGAPQMSTIGMPTGAKASRAAPPAETSDLFASLKPPQKPNLAAASSSLKPSASNEGNAFSSSQKARGASGEKLILFYNGANSASNQAVDTIVQTSVVPHHKLFEWSVDIVNVKQIEMNNHMRIYEKLRTMPQFQRPLEQECVLFDCSQNMAYYAPQAIAGVIQQYKNNIVCALIDKEINGQFAPSTITNSNSSGSSREERENAEKLVGLRGGRAPTSGSISSPPDAKPVAAFARRSVLRGMTKEDMKRIADEEEMKASQSGRGSTGFKRGKQATMTSFESPTDQEQGDQGDPNAHLYGTPFART